MLSLPRLEAAQAQAHHLQSLARATAAAMDDPLLLGDPSADLVYTPVAPCRYIYARSLRTNLASATIRNRSRARSNTPAPTRRHHLDDWSAFLTRNMAEARPVLSLVLAGDRIAFSPVSGGRYELTLPVAFDRMLEAVIPEMGRLQDLGTSPAGFEPALPA